MNAALVLCATSALCSSALCVAGWRRRTSPGTPGTLLLGLALLALESAFGGLTLSAVTPEKAALWQKFGTLAAAFLPGVWLWFSLTYSRGDPGRAWARWRPALALAFATIPLAGLWWGEPLEPLAARALSAGPRPPFTFQLGPVGFFVHLLLLLGSVLILMNLERTFRASVGTMRWRIKFVVLGGVVLFAARIYACGQALLYSRIDSAMEVPLLAGALLVACFLIAWSFARSAFEGVAVYPSGGMMEGSLTLSLTGLYLLVVGALAKVLTLLGVYPGFPVGALLIMTGIMAVAMILLSERIRQRTRRFFSWCLKRPFYNYPRLWMAFAEQTGSVLNEADLSRAVAKLTAETFQVLSLTIWLIEENKQLVFGASTSLLGREAKGLLQDPACVAGLVEAMRTHPYPVDIDECTESWVETLKSCNPGFFRNGGNRLCMPLVARDDVLGLISLGDRVSTLPFSAEDKDLLKCIGDHVAASLLNLRLSRKLLRAKELEAFQAMSAFFVHDLKNTTHSLSLLLQNLPAHFQDPAFRDDAQRAVSNSVAHLNALVGRLGLLRQKLEVSLKEIDLVSVVRSALDNLHLPSDELDLDLRPLPAILADAEQIQKVVTNLVLNAREAGAVGQKIEVSTALRDRWAVLSVRDHGCGISPEFISRSLFRPFQTTKRNGIGIGMFQSKIIIEAHQGEIEVESELGQGATVRVLLPLKGQQRET